MRKKKEIDFAEIGKRLGISALTAQNAYNNAIRKIRAYLLKNKNMRQNLQDGLETLEAMKSNKDERDIAFKSGDY